MLWQKKFLEQAVDLQKRFAIQQDLVAFDCQESPISEALNSFGETFGELDPEFLFEVSAAYVTELQLQNELAQDALFIGRRQRAPDRQLVSLQRRGVSATSPVR